MVNKYKLNTGASVKDYNKVSDWLSFEIPNKIKISSGKVDRTTHKYNFSSNLFQRVRN